MTARSAPQANEAEVASQLTDVCENGPFVPAHCIHDQRSYSACFASPFKSRHDINTLCTAPCPDPHQSGVVHSSRLNSYIMRVICCVALAAALAQAVRAGDLSAASEQHESQAHARGLLGDALPSCRGRDRTFAFKPEWKVRIVG